jgi:hypothetical protein
LFQRGFLRIPLRFSAETMGKDAIVAGLLPGLVWRELFRWNAESPLAGREVSDS